MSDMLCGERGRRYNGSFDQSLSLYRFRQSESTDSQNRPSADVRFSVADDSQYVHGKRLRQVLNIPVELTGKSRVSTRGEVLGAML